jgi:hypothetical protein
VSNGRDGTVGKGKAWLTSAEALPAILKTLLESPTRSQGEEGTRQVPGQMSAVRPMIQKPAAASSRVRELQ